jgi:hypothetical protein
MSWWSILICGGSGWKTLPGVSIERIKIDRQIGGIRIVFIRHSHAVLVMHRQALTIYGILEWSRKKG